MREQTELRALLAVTPTLIFAPCTWSGNSILPCLPNSWLCTDRMTPPLTRLRCRTTHAAYPTYLSTLLTGPRIQPSPGGLGGKTCAASVTSFVLQVSRFHPLTKRPMARMPPGHHLASLSANLTSNSLTYACANCHIKQGIQGKVNANQGTYSLQDFQLYHSLDAAPIQ
jgi:hypothetical protein